uniref:Uncharacterized protein n=1 Tax=Lepeophtheirus salmonis TaxID=72036 RepID=A0A0K2VA29_LEPSM
MNLKCGETANILSLIKEFWCRINVKNKLEVHRLKDNRRTVVDFRDCETLIFLKQFIK